MQSPGAAGEFCVFGDSDLEEIDTERGAMDLLDFIQGMSL